VVDANTRTRILRDGSLVYDLNVFGTKNDAQPSTYTILNGLTYSKALQPEVTVAARLSRLDGRAAERKTVGYNGAASLTVAPVDRLRHTLVASSVRNDTGRTVSDSTSVLLTSVAELYRGVNVRLVLGESRLDAGAGVTRSREVRLASTIVPHPKFVFNLSYTDRRADVPVTQFDPSRKIGEASIAYRPFPQLYLFSSRQIVDDASAPRDTLDRISVSWNPFASGTLQLSLLYNEQSRDVTGRKESTFLPSLSWRIRGGTYLIVSYQDVRIRSDLEATRSKLTSATLRATF
jgi:hypothetical protein